MDWVALELVGQIVNKGIPVRLLCVQPGEFTLFKARLGTIGGGEVALIVIVFVLGAPAPLNVKEAVYIPDGKVTGNGVLLLSLEIEGGPPLFAENDQVTVVVEVMLLPVSTKENKIVDPAQTLSVFIVGPVVSYMGSVTKLAFN
jgi:hypothetical protein